jgi:type II secretory ATPase GspE/PulE/Tfp pilus assembly ATPase PilB-like protein
VIAQRLVRRLCEHCKVPYSANLETRMLLGLAPDRPATLYRAEGCPQCHYQGFKGRMAILEILRCDDEIDELIAHGASQQQLLQAARRNGFRSIAEDAARRIVDGVTSIDEAARVVDLNRLVRSATALASARAQTATSDRATGAPIGAALTEVDDGAV